MNKNFGLEIKAIEEIYKLLEPLEPASRERVINYVLNSLGVKLSNNVENGGFSSPSVEFSESSGVVQKSSSLIATNQQKTLKDIRTLKVEKDPKSAIEMTVLVAYYLSELATGEESKQEVGTEDIKMYFKQAGYPVPSAPRKTLNNTKSAGYIENTSRGAYKLNAVGYNLVEHSMPTNSKTQRKSKKKKVKKAVKKN